MNKPGLDEALGVFIFFCCPAVCWTRGLLLLSFIFILFKQSCSTSNFAIFVNCMCLRKIDFVFVISVTVWFLQYLIFTIQDEIIFAPKDNVTIYRTAVRREKNRIYIYIQWTSAILSFCSNVWLFTLCDFFNKVIVRDWLCGSV